MKRRLPRRLHNDLSGTNHPHICRMAPTICCRDGKSDHKIARSTWVKLVSDRCRPGAALADDAKLLQPELHITIAISRRIRMTGLKGLQHTGNGSLFYPKPRDKTVQILPGIIQSVKCQLSDEHGDRPPLARGRLQQPIPQLTRLDACSPILIEPAESGISGRLQQRFRMGLCLDGHKS